MANPLTVEEARKILGVSADASDKDIKAARIRLIKQGNADFNASKRSSEDIERANERLKDINNAVDVLTGKSRARDAQTGGGSQGGYSSEWDRYNSRRDNSRRQQAHHDESTRFRDFSAVNLDDDVHINRNFYGGKFSSRGQKVILKAYFVGCNFTEADFSGVVLDGVTFSNCSAGKIKFDGAIFKNNSSIGGDFRSASFRNADLRGLLYIAKFTLLEDACFDGCMIDQFVLDTINRHIQAGSKISLKNIRIFNSRDDEITSKFASNPDGTVTKKHQQPGQSYRSPPPPRGSHSPSPPSSGAGRGTGYGDDSSSLPSLDDDDKRNFAMAGIGMGATIFTAGAVVAMQAKKNADGKPKTWTRRLAPWAIMAAGILLAVLSGYTGRNYLTRS